MGTIATRIIEIVNALGGNKSEFARRINVTPAYISKIGKHPDRTPSDLTIMAICREFNVSERWLRTGEGDMFPEKSLDEELSALFADVMSGNEEFKRCLLSILLHMSPEEWKLVEKKAWELVAEMKKSAHNRMEAAEEIPTDMKKPTPVSESGLESEKKVLMDAVDQMNPGQQQMYFDQMSKLKESQTEASPF